MISVYTYNHHNSDPIEVGRYNMPLQDALNEFVKLCAKHGCKTELIKKNDIKFDVKISGGDTSSLLWDAAKVGEFQGNPPTMYTLVDSNIPTHTYLKTGMYKD